MDNDDAPLKRLAIVIRRIGPYHYARLKAAAQGATVLAIETCKTDDTYSWANLPGQDGFDRVTLFERETDAASISRLKRKVNSALSNFRPNVVAVPGWADPAGLLAFAWAKSERLPVVLMSDSQAEDGPRYRWSEAIKGAVVRGADAGFVAGRRHADYLAQLGMPREQITLGYDVVDNEHFSKGAATFRDTPHLAAQSEFKNRSFMAVARFVPRKNLLSLINAHARYLQLCVSSGATPWGLVLVGDGSEKCRLRAAAHPEVQFLSFAQYDDLPSLYASAAAVVVPSLVEQWGLVVNEAMAAGCPVIVSTRCGAAGELVVDGVTGHLTEPDDESLTLALQRMASLSTADRVTMTSAATLVVRNWGLKRFGDGLLISASTAEDCCRVRPILPLLLRMLAGRMRNSPK